MKAGLVQEQKPVDGFPGHSVRVIPSRWPGQLLTTGRARVLAVRDTENLAHFLQCKERKEHALHEQPLHGVP